MLVSGLNRLICLCGGYFREGLFREDKNNVNIAQTITCGSCFNKRPLSAQLCRLTSKTAFLNTSNGLIFSEVLRCSCSNLFFKIGVLKIFENFTIKRML